MDDGYVYVPGTFIAAYHSDTRDTVSLDSVPAEILPVLCYTQSMSTGQKAIRYDIAVQSNDTTVIQNPEWGYCRRIVLNTSASGAAVFDTTSGFQGVWHLDEGGNDPAHDATANHFDGIANSMSGASPSPGAVGNARAFDGESSSIFMPNTASGRLNFPEDGHFTVSAWVYADTLDYTSDYMYHTIVSKGHQQYFLQLTSFPTNTPLWEFTNFTEADKWHMSTWRFFMPHLNNGRCVRFAETCGIVEHGREYMGDRRCSTL